MDPETNRATPAVLYLRIPSAQQDTSAILDRQREGCRHIATQYGLTIVREYVDLECPAELEQQTALLRLLEELWQQRDAAFVVVWDYARLASDLTQLNDVIRRIHGCGAEVATLTGMRAAHRYVEEQQNNRKREG